MNISIFVTFWVAGISPSQTDEHFRGEPLKLLSANPDIVSVEHYLPATGDDVPKFDDIPAPNLIVQINLESPDAAITLTESAEFKAMFTDKNIFDTPIDEVKVDIHETVNYNLPGLDTPPARTKPLSFVIRYYGPVEDAADFVDFYTTNHPPILAKFPDVRNVFCYLPLDWKNKGKAADQEFVIGNEVVFDDIAGLNAALQSPVLEEAMADSEQFKSYGYSSHHAMWREYVYQR